jgi:dienelactone hydrolase
MRTSADIKPSLEWNAKDIKQHKMWRGKFKTKLKQLTGYKPESVPLSVEWKEKIKTEFFERHKIYIRSEKDYWIPAYYFVPEKINKNIPAIVCLHGHSGILPYIGEGSTANEKKMTKEYELDFPVFLARNGYVTIAPVQRGWNETRKDVKNETGCNRMTMNSFLLGMTPVGIRCHDASVLIDFLSTQSVVDASSIGAAGLSGGGMVGLFWAALEDRVKFAMIAGYYCTFKDSIYSINHCICNCVPGIMRYGEMRDVAALIAPRPLLIISGTKDPIFPIKATKKAYQQLLEVYKLLGAEENIEKDFFKGPHSWSNRKTLSFLRKHLGAGKFEKSR